MQPISNMWLVVHVPKTAGTSFRKALEKYFGTTRVIRDYGKIAEATTEVVRQQLYNNASLKQPDELIEVISKGSAKVLVGHFPVRKYARYFRPENIIAFVRDPLVRTCSEYLHRMRNSSYEGSFSDFMGEPSIGNIQSRFLQDIPENSFIGVTEQYRESVAYVNGTFQLKLRTLNKNTDRKGGGRKFADNLSKHEVDQFYKLNQEDLELYCTAVQKFAGLDIPESSGAALLRWLK